MATPNKDGEGWSTPPFEQLPLFDAGGVQRPAGSGSSITDRDLALIKNLQIATERMVSTLSDFTQAHVDVAQSLNKQLELGNKHRRTRVSHEKQTTDELRKQDALSAKLIKQEQLRIKDEERHAKLKERTTKAMATGAVAVQRELADLGLKETGGTYRYRQGEEFRSMSSSEMRSLMAAQRAGNATPEQQAKLSALQETMLLGSIQRGSKNPNDPRFRIREFLGAGFRMDIGGAMSELNQRTMVQDRLAGRIGGLGERIGASRLGNIPGVSGAINRVFPALESLVAQPIGYYAAGAFAARKAIQQYNQTRQIGMITGEGFGAGLGARAHAFGMGINPFDILSPQQALQIEMGVRGIGFRGRQADTLSSAIGDITNKLGVDFKKSIEIADVAINQGGASISQFSGIMNQMGATARATGASVANIQEALATLQTSMVQHGATSMQTAVQFNAAQSVLKGTDLARHPQVTSAWMGQVQPLIAAAAGVPLWRAYMMGAKAWGQSLDTLLDEYLRGKPTDMSLREYAALLVTTGAPLFQGLDVPQAQQLLSRRARGGSFGQQARTQAYFTGLHDARSLETSISSHYDNDRLSRTGKVPAYRREHRAELAYIRTLRQGAIRAGVSGSMADSILAPLRSQVITHAGQSNDPFQHQQHQTELALRNAVRQVEIRLKGSAERLFTANNTGWNRYVGGQGSSVGTTRWP